MTTQPITNSEFAAILYAEPDELNICNVGSELFKALSNNILAQSTWFVLHFTDLDAAK